jgi:hypothetical protein
MFFIQYFGSDSWLIWGLAIAFAFMIWTQVVIAFHMPHEGDFTTDEYRKEAYEAAEKLMINTETRAWNERGFFDKFKASRGMTIRGMRLNRNSDTAEVTKYFKGGEYQVHTGVEISLSATSNDKKTTIHNKQLILKEYIVTIKANPRRNWYGTVDLNWMITDIKVKRASNSEAQISTMVKNWKVPPDKQPDW